MRTCFMLVLAVSAAAPDLAVAQGDQMNGALAIGAGPSGPYSSVGATTSFVWPCAGGGNDVWFATQVAAAGAMTIDTCGSAFDTALEVFDITTGPLLSLACNDDSCGLQSSVNFPGLAGQKLLIRVGGYNGAVGTFNMNLSPGLSPLTNVAAHDGYGVGCYKLRNSFYEYFAMSSSFDLTGTGFSMLPNAAWDYVVTPPVSPYLPPSPNALNLAMGDDTESMVNLTVPFPFNGGVTPSLAVCSNGFVSVASGNGLGYSPSIATHLNDPMTAWRNWHDYAPNLGGAVWFEQIGPIAYITWDNVPDYGNPASANTFQMQFDCGTGIVTMHFIVMSAGGNARLVGYSTAGASLATDPHDLSVAIPITFQVHAVDGPELVLTASSRPVLGSTLTLDSSNVPLTAVAGMQVLSFVQQNPGIDLTGFGMPGCFQYLNLDFIFPLVPSGGSATYPGSVPNAASLNGFHVFAQSAMLVPAVNPLGAISSNGTDLTLGVN